MSIFRKRKRGKKDGRQRLSKYVEGRDYVFAKVSNTKHLYSFQSHPRNLPLTTVLVEFKNLPSLRKKIKDQKKFNTLLKYKIKQCSWVFNDDSGFAITIKPPHMSEGDEGAIHSVPMNKKMRKAQKTKELQALVDLFPFSDPHGKPNEKSRKKRVNKEKARQKKKAQKWKKKFSRKKTDVQPSRHYELRAQFNKTDVLVELQEYVLSFDATPRKKLNDSHVGQILHMAAKNIFTPLPYFPPKHIPHVRVKASSSRCTVEVVDKPISENWSHRSHVQKILVLVMLHCSESSFQKHFGSRRFLTRYINLLQSPDELEREYVQVILVMIHRLGTKTMKELLCRLISNAIGSFTSDSINQKAYTAGTTIRALLMIILKAPSICGPDGWRVVLPLYWSSMQCFVRYHQEMFKCILKFVSDDHKLVAPITSSLLRHWSRSNAFKQLSYLDQLFAIFLELVKRWEPSNSKNQAPALAANEWYYMDEDKIHLEKNISSVFQQLCLCIVGNHYDVSQAALRVLDHPAVFFPYIINPDPIKETSATTATTTMTTMTTLTTTKAKHGLAEYERIHNHFLPGVYKAFRRQVEIHMYIEVRKTLDTLMGIMEKHWPTLCQQCVEEQEERILWEQQRKVQKQVSNQRLIQLSQEQQKKLNEKKKQMDAMNIIFSRDSTGEQKKTKGLRNYESHNTTMSGSSQSVPWNMREIQAQRKRTWSLWEEGKRPTTRRGTCPLSFEQVAQQHRRKNSLELLAATSSTDVKVDTGNPRLSLPRHGSLKILEPVFTKEEIATEEKQVVLSPKEEFNSLSPKLTEMSISSSPKCVSPKSEDAAMFPKIEQKQIFSPDIVDSEENSEDQKDEKERDDSSEESVVSTCSQSQSYSQSQSGLYSELFVDGMEISQLSQISIDCSRIEVSQSFKLEHSSDDDDLDLDLNAKNEYDEDSSQEIFSAARAAQLSLLLGESSQTETKAEHRLSVADTRLTVLDTT